MNFTYSLHNFNNFLTVEEEDWIENMIEDRNRVKKKSCHLSEQR